MNMRASTEECLLDLDDQCDDCYFNYIALMTLEYLNNYGLGDSFLNPSCDP